MNQSRKTPASVVAFGGVMAALAVVVMSLGGLIPVATYVSPMLGAILLQTVLISCGERIAWAWYGAVGILALLMSPDKEAAAVFVFLGYYPIVKPKLDALHLGLVWKTVYFNVSIGVMYFLLLKILGMEALNDEFAELGIVMLIALLVLGNVTFFMLDRLLGMEKFRKRFLK